MPVLPFGGPVPSPSPSEGFGPCEAWEPLWDCAVLPTGSEAISGTMVQAATEILWARTGMRFDQCVITVRPCRRSCFGEQWPFSGSWWEVGTMYPRPVLFDGNWYNVACGDCGDSCSCTRVEEVILPGPITLINTVKVDGVTLPASAYRLDDWRRVVRIDGGSWPICNDLNKADTEEGTWSIQATYGEPVPVLGRLAVGELALQLIYKCLGMDCCVLPQEVQQLTRQGVTIEYLDPQQLFSANRIGLTICDQFIDAYNPYGVRQKPQVYSLDSPRPRITGV